MGSEVTNPQAPSLVRVPQVELMRTGTWQGITGEHTFTRDDLAAAVAALGCPSVRRAPIRLGHVDPRFDGEPAVGYIDNLAVTDGGATLVGDYAGLPGWMTTEVLASAYPDRSIEGEYDHRCQVGHTHPFVLTGLALLGVTAPAVGNLTSLQDVAARFGVAASRPGAGAPVTVHLRGARMPNPTPTTVALGVTVEDVRRKFYETADWSLWIEEIQLDPLQLITLDDADGKRARVPIIIGAGDGSDAVTFGDEVPVVVRYDDAGAPDLSGAGEAGQVAASRQVVRFASRAESRPTASKPAAAAGGKPQGSKEVQMALREDLIALLQLDDTVSDEDIVAAVEALEQADTGMGTTVAEGGEPVAASAALTLPDGVVAMDAAALKALQVSAARGEDARRQQERESREREVDDAVRLGKITPATRGHYLKLAEVDFASTKALLSSLAPGLVPVTGEIGHSQAPSVAHEDALYESLFGKGGN